MPLPSATLARRLVTESSVLLLPGSMFTPQASELGQRSVRIAFANVGAAGLRTLAGRLAAFRP